MKALALIFFGIISLNLNAQDLGLRSDTLVEVLLDKTHPTTLRIEESTFIPNIMGYACPVPAINLAPFNVWERRLRHNSMASFGVKTFALQIENPNMRFCEWPNATEVFGEEFQVGAEVKLEIRTIRSLVKRIDHNGDERLILRETISSSLNNKQLFSTAEVDLTARQ